MTTLRDLTVFTIYIVVSISNKQDLPEPVPLSGKIPQEFFGDCVLLLEFLHAYEEELGLQEDFPEGVTLGTV